MTTEFRPDPRTVLPIICPAQDCGSQAFQRIVEGAGVWNFLCEMGHILWRDAMGRVEIVGYQPLNNDETFIALAQSYIDRVQKGNIAMGMRKASDEECAKAVKMAANAALRATRGHIIR